MAYTRHMVNRLSTEKRAQIVACLIEGMSIRATVRVTGAAKNTITKLLVELGGACAEYQNAALFDLPCTNIQCDEIWSFCYAKRKNVPDEHRTSSATATCGPGRRSAPTPNWSPHGWWVSAPQRLLSFPAGLGIPTRQPRPAHHRWPTTLCACR